jgi:hypothetical protein
MLPIGKISRLFLSTVVFIGIASKAQAQVTGQGGTQHAQIDCDAFKKGADGSWVITRQTTIKIGTSSITNSAGITPRGSINGIDVQNAINQQCSQTASLPTTRPDKVAPVYSRNNWKANANNAQTLPECLARASEMVQGFPVAVPAGEAVVARFDGFTYIIRCTPRKFIFFAVVGPPGSTQEQNQVADGLFDRIFNDF